MKWKSSSWEGKYNICCVTLIGSEWYAFEMHPAISDLWRGKKKIISLWETHKKNGKLSISPLKVSFSKRTPSKLPCNVNESHKWTAVDIIVLKSNLVLKHLRVSTWKWNALFNPVISQTNAWGNAPSTSQFSIWMALRMWWLLSCFSMGIWWREEKENCENWSENWIRKENPKQVKLECVGE